MKIGLIAPLRRRIPPSGHAGTERIVDALARGLSERGHEVTLFATADSHSPSKLVGTWPHEAKDLDLKIYNLVLANHLLEIARRDRTVDVWSNHVLDFPPALAPLLKAPMVTTIHEARTDNIAKVSYLTNAAKDSHFISISKRQQELFSPVPIRQVIYNGVNTDTLALGSGNGGYFAWIGWVSEIKGTADAIRIAQKAKVPLKIAGMVAERNRSYFASEIEPYLSNTIEYIGEIDDAEKGVFLGNARGLLSPLHWEEPFGLVAAEAMACGTPVFTTCRGAMPELVKDGVTGHLAETNDALAEFVQTADGFDRTMIRQHVIDNFSVNTMVKQYEKLYQTIVDGTEA